LYARQQSAEQNALLQVWPLPQMMHWRGSGMGFTRTFGPEKPDIASIIAAMPDMRLPNVSDFFASVIFTPLVMFQKPDATRESGKSHQVRSHGNAPRECFHKSQPGRALCLFVPQRS